VASGVPKYRWGLAPDVGYRASPGVVDAPTTDPFGASNGCEPRPRRCASLPSAFASHTAGAELVVPVTNATRRGESSRIKWGNGLSSSAMGWGPSSSRLRSPPSSWSCAWLARRAEPRVAPELSRSFSSLPNWRPTRELSRWSARPARDQRSRPGAPPGLPRRRQYRVEKAREAFVQVLAAQRVQAGRALQPLADYTGLPQHLEVMRAGRLHHR
jgi:hypothetical protein